MCLKAAELSLELSTGDLPANSSDEGVSIDHIAFRKFRRSKNPGAVACSDMKRNMRGWQDANVLPENYLS